MPIRTIEWRSGCVVMLDQRVLPTREVYRVYRDYQEVARAIKDMVIRGAPAIGVAAAMGIALGARTLRPSDTPRDFERLCRAFASTRPTAVNLFWAIQRMRRVFARNRHRSPDTLRTLLEREALAIHDEDVAANRALGAHGAPLLEDGATVLTHCNAGALATAGHGTALAIVRAAVEAGKRIQVIACETRPFLQGARLTAWELKKDRIPATLITDNMAGHLMQRGLVSCVIVGTDRTAANGDVANKIGTYPLAVLAHRHAIPFYVAAPISSIDLDCPCGDKIPIEERPAREVTHVLGRQIAPSGVRVLNPAFDVTPNELVTAIVTERGVARQPLGRTLPRLVRGAAVEAKPERKAEARRVRARRR
ncbi:MAG: S-methyl-5-thioribose-1-phosphate isomerase [Deltaproteobacteria bacterium]|nr:MAG: S-methyl-5-thioribose-1-phosphate isomerase [Deltaproteobacteria bacterium]